MAALIIKSHIFFRKVVSIRQYWFHKNTYYSDPDKSGRGVWVYDIALLKLSEMITTFTPICLPNINEDYSDSREIHIFGMCMCHYYRV